MDATADGLRILRRRWRRFVGIPPAVHGAALLFGATMLGFLLIYPMFHGFDEPQHVDRIYATTDGNLLPDPGELPVAQGISRAQDEYVLEWPYASDRSYVYEEEIPRGERPSLIDLGGHSTESPGGYSNQLSEHPPAFYWLLGGVMWLIPGDAQLPVDLYVAILRGLDIALLLPVPYLVWWGVRKVTGEGSVAQAAAFVPALIPGLARVGATVNNDNLLILTTTALLALLAGVVKGDHSMRTAWWVAALLVLSLLTKGNALVLPLVVGLAYLVGWHHTRGRPPWRPFLVVVLGAAAGGLWWLSNLVRFGSLRPSGWGERLASALGPPRPPDDPARSDLYWDYIQQHLADRFWGGLGLIEPPNLPGWSVAALTWILVGGLVLALVFGRPNRGAIAVLISGFVISVGAMIITAWWHYQSYLTIPGVQGRYHYPFVLAVAASIAVGLGVVLGRRRWLAPAAVVVAALVVEYLAVEAVVAHTWLPEGQLPRPGNIGRALDNITRFSPFPPPVTVGLLAVVLLAVAAAIVLTAIGVRRERRAAAAGATPDEVAPEPDEGLRSGRHGAALSAS